MFLVSFLFSMEHVPVCPFYDAETFSLLSSPSPVGQGASASHPGCPFLVISAGTECYHNSLSLSSPSLFSSLSASTPMSAMFISYFSQELSSESPSLDFSPFLICLAIPLWSFLRYHLSLACDWPNSAPSLPTPSIYFGLHTFGLMLCVQVIGLSGVRCSESTQNLALC